MSSKLDGVVLTTLEDLANHERRLRQAIAGDGPPTPEELELNSDPFDGTKHTLPRSEPSPKQLREWWAAVSQTWLAYSREAHSRRTLDPVAELAKTMSVIAGNLAAGIVPQYISNVVVRGSPPMGFYESYDIGVAVAYRLACTDEGLTHNSRVIRIFDNEPTRTIADAYGVTKTTVKGWVTKHSPRLLTPDDITAGILTGMMKISGKRYQKAGRSESARNKRLIRKG
jgi:hypothetical protein